MSGLAVAFAALAMGAAIVDWFAVARQRPAVEYVAKPLTMVALTAMAVAVSAPDPTRQMWFVAAAVFCVAGDIFLMLPRDRFIPGLVAFLVGHICYTAGFLSEGVSGTGAALGLLVVTVAVILIGRPVLAGVRRVEPALRVPVLGYLVVISVMVVAAFAGGPLLAIVGALLFYASDSMIAWRRFLDAPQWASVAIIVSYHAAQLALLGSLATG